VDQLSFGHELAGFAKQPRLPVAGNYFDNFCQIDRNSGPLFGPNFN
jgi:hypothetical protein